MEKKKIYFIAFVVIVLILLIIIGYFVFYKKDKAESPIDEVEEKIVEEKEEVDMSDWEIYENEEYGFSLKFPEAWKNYTTKKRILSWGDDTSDSIDFGFLEQDSLFNISVHEKNQWQKIQSEEQPNPTYLGENDRYVFGYAQAQYVRNEIMAERMKEVILIVNTFELNLE